MHATLTLLDTALPSAKPAPALASRAADGDAEFAALIWLEEFIALAQSALAAEDDEQERRRCEDALLRRVPYLRAAGLFDVFEIAHPALRAMVHAHA